MSAPNDIMAQILGELATPATARVEPSRERVLAVVPSPEEREARARASLAVMLGKKLGRNSAATDDEVRAFILAAQERRKKQVLGDGGISRRLIVEDGGVGLGDIANLRKEGVYQGEIEKYLEDKERASIGPDGKPQDDFRTFSAMQQQAHADLNAQAPFTRDTPPSASGAFLGSSTTLVAWGSGGYDGVSATPGLSVEAAIQGATQLARWTGTDAETTPVTAALAVTPSQIPTNSLVFRPYAVVQFGTANVLLTAIIDIGRGCIFSVPGSACILSCGMEGTGTAQAVQAGGFNTLTVAGSLSFKTINPTSRLTRTLYANPSFTTSATNFYVPPFAKRVSVIIAGNATALTINVVDSHSNVMGTFLLATGATSVLDIPLPGNANQVIVTKTGGADIGGAAIFELNLG